MIIYYKNFTQSNINFMIFFFIENTNLKLSIFQAANVLNQLTANAINEARYQDASWYFWILAKQCLDIVTEKNDIESELLKKYHEYERKACIYYAYDVIHKYLVTIFSDLHYEMYLYC